MKYQDIKKQSEEKLSKLLTDLRVFWAFSDSQYKEGKVKIAFRQSDPEEKLCRVPGGGFIPSKNVKAMTDGIDAINKWERAEIKKYKQQDEEIKSELYNYECFYSGSIETAVERNPQYSPERIMQVYNAERKNAFINQ